MKNLEIEKEIILEIKNEVTGHTSSFGKSIILAMEDEKNNSDILEMIDFQAIHNIDAVSMVISTKLIHKVKNHQLLKKTHSMPLAAIWLEKSLKMQEHSGYRITEGDLIKIENNEVVDCDGKATHVITGCYGGIYGPFEVVCMDIKSHELIKVQI